MSRIIGEMLAEEKLFFGRVNKMESGNLDASKGGKARALSLSPEKRREIAKQAAAGRWGQDLPQALNDGQLQIAGRLINCAVLETGKRLLTQDTFLTAIGRSARPKAGTGITLVDGLPSFLAADNLKEFITDEIRESTTPIVFWALNGRRSYGYDALLLPMVCEVYLKARDQRKLAKTQEHIARVCDLLMRGFARVGIIALVDEATGYQEQRAKDELNRILEKYIAPELRPYMPLFPPEFFKQVYRLHGWTLKAGGAKTQGPRYIGKFINKYVYEPLPPGVLPELRKKNPVTEKGYRRYKHSQFLTPDTGIPALDKQVSNVTMLMRISDAKDQFENNFDKAYAPYYQNRLPLVVDVESGTES
jgi:hypothetical protein